ncbi:TPA: hypothetical protein ACGUW8_004199 [Vibrio vulnificus]
MSIKFDINFARGWMVIWGGVFVACITALLAFDNMDKIAAKNLKKEQYFAYLELLSVLQDWKRFTQRIRQEVEPALQMNTSDRVFYKSKMVVDESLSQLDLSKIQFLSRKMSAEFRNQGGNPSEYDYFNVGNYSELQYNFQGFINILKLRNEVYDKAIKPAIKKSNNSKHAFLIDHNYIKGNVNYVDFTDYIQLTEHMFVLNDDLVRFLEYFSSCLVENAGEVLDQDIIIEQGGLPKIQGIDHDINLSIAYSPLPDIEHKKLRDIFDPAS